MNFKNFLSNIFSKEESKTVTEQPSQRQNNAGRSNYSDASIENNSTSAKYDTTELRKLVSEEEYISNLRLGRSWILPQLIQMGIIQKGLLKNFDIEYYTKNLLRKYNDTPAGRNAIWSLIRRNYKAIATTNGNTKRASWWTKSVLMEMIKWDFSLVGKARRGLNRPACIDILKNLDQNTGPLQMCNTIEKYDKSRMRKREALYQYPLPYCFINAFMADGAYNAMMTMVKVLGLRIKNDNGDLLSRDECITLIEEQSSRLNGRELLEFCKVKFFDSGVFEYNKYVR